VPAAPPDLDPDFSPLARERHVALAVSGGSDSTALMHLAKAWAERHYPDLKLTALTVDHALRPEAAGEAKTAGEWAERLGLSHHILTWEGPKPETGLQARAREARYGLMAEWCRTHGAGLLLTGHTLDDQAETVLMRLERSLSPGSLAGIAQAGEWEGVALLRPLLSISRQALRDYLAALGQDWIEDPSNEDRRFERVRVRHAMNGLLSQGVTPERLAALAETSARTNLLLERLAGQWLSRWLKEEDWGICHAPKEPFIGLPPPLQQHILGRIIRHYGGGEARPEAEELRRAARWVTEGPVRCTLGGAVLGRRKLGFWVTREAARIAAEPLIIPAAGTAIWDGRFRIDASPGAKVRAAGEKALAISEEVPAFVRRAYPLVEQPEGAREEPCIAFQRLAPV
jgi:tRNA(Ile)-lysidine synthase